MTTYGYIRTSRQRIQGTAGSDPEAQAHQLRQEGVPEANIYRDVGVSGGTGTNSRAGWRALNAQLVSGDILVVVAIDRIGRRWMDTVNAVRDLRTREVRIRSLAQTEATWVTYLASEPDTAEAVIGDILTTFMAWAAEQELQAVSRRTKAGLERARAEGKTLGPPPRVDDDQVEDMARLRREGQSFRSIGRIFGVSRTTVQRRLQEQEAVNLEDSQTS
jgi:putative DNA-invertase from lambdoid prophage Rac